MREWGEFFVDKQEKKQLRRIEDEFGMTPDESQIFRDYLHAVSYTHLTLPTNREV